MFLWFLWSTLAASIYIIVVGRFASKNSIIEMLLLFVGFTFVWIFPNSEMNLYLYPYFVAGYLISKKNGIQTLSKKQITVLGTLSIILFVVLFAFFKEQDFIYVSGITFNSKISWKQQILIDIYRWIIGFAGCGALAYIVFTIQGILKKIKVLVDFGRNSLQIYIFQCSGLSWFMARVIPKVVVKIRFDLGTSFVWIYNLIFTPIMALVIIMILNQISEVIGKNKRISKLLFGR